MDFLVNSLDVSQISLEAYYVSTTDMYEGDSLISRAIAPEYIWER